MKEPYDDGGVPLGSRGVDWIDNDPVRSAQRQAWKDSRDMWDLGGGKDGPGEIVPAQEEVERLARRMCVAAGEKPDARDVFQVAGAQWSLSGLIHPATYGSRPWWRRYEDDARNALVARAYREETGL